MMKYENDILIKYSFQNKYQRILNRKIRKGQRKKQSEKKVRKWF